MPLQANQMSVHELLEMIFQNKWVFLGCTLIGLCLSIYVVQKTPKWYESYAGILVEDRQSTDPMIKGLGVSTSVHRRFSMVKSKIMAIPNLMKIVPELRLENYKHVPKMTDKAKQAQEWERAANSVLDSTSMYVRGGEISVRAERQNPEEAKRIVERISRAITDEHITVREEQIDRASELLAKLLSYYRDKLNTSEWELKNFQELHMLDLTDESSDLRRTLTSIETDTATPRTVVSRLLDLIERRNNNAVRLKAIEAEREELRRKLQLEPEYLVSEETTEQSELFRQLDARLAKACASLAELRMDRSDEHPMVKEKLNEIARFEEQIENASEPVVRGQTKTANEIRADLRVQINKADTEIASLKSQREPLNEEVRVLSERVRTIPDRELKRSDIIREKGIWADMYSTIRMRYENARLTHELEKEDRKTRFSLISPARFNPKPIRPNSTFIYLMGTFIGMIVGVALCFLREFTDTSFRNLDDASRYLDLPVLGVIPEVTGVSLRRRRRRQAV